MGNIGNLLDYPRDIYAINNNGFWRVFVTNARTDACRDHTDGFGNMLLVNGEPVADVNLWQQTITVKPSITCSYRVAFTDTFMRSNRYI